jgi:hypothetical protein
MLEHLSRDVGTQCQINVYLIIEQPRFNTYILYCNVIFIGTCKNYINKIVLNWRLVLTELAGRFEICWMNNHRNK